MKTKAIALTLITAFCAIAASAQTTPEPVLWPMGGWMACLVQQAAGICPPPEIVATMPKPYLLMIPLDDIISAVAFRWTVTGTLASGAPVNQTGIVDRANAVSGYCDASFDAGGQILNPVITITSLVPIRVAAFLSTRRR